MLIRNLSFFTISTLALFFPQTSESRPLAPPPLSISCSNKACPTRSPHDICHFGKKESWYEKGLLRNRYNLYCEPACLPSGSSCWISGFPEPGRDNFLHFTTGKKPVQLYTFNLTAKGYRFVLELLF